MKNEQGKGVGVTNGAGLVRFSNVHFPNLEATMLKVPQLGCATLNFAECAAQPGKSRWGLLSGLFKGAGNTAAHELGHQAETYFLKKHVVDCLDCYDNDTTEGSYAAFFGTLRWSSYAATKIWEILPPANRR